LGPRKLFTINSLCRLLRKIDEVIDSCGWLESSPGVWGDRAIERPSGSLQSRGCQGPVTTELRLSFMEKNCPDFFVGCDRFASATQATPMATASSQPPTGRVRSFFFTPSGRGSLRRNDEAGRGHRVDRWGRMVRDGLSRMIEPSPFVPCDPPRVRVRSIARLAFHGEVEGCLRFCCRVGAMVAVQ
jgi:hypothetical protein